MNPITRLIDFFKERRIISHISVSVTRKWGLPSYGSVEFHQGLSATGLLANPEKLSSELNDQAQRMVEERGAAYIKRIMG